MGDINISLISEIAQYLAGSGYGQLGTNIFIGDLPKDVNEGVALISSPSPAPLVYIDQQQTIIDFWCRASHGAQVNRDIQEIYNLFHREAQYQTANWYIFLSQAVGQPVDMGFDEEGGKLLKLSVQFFCRNLNTIS